MKFVNLGTRNKPTCWEYLAAHSFLHVQLPGTDYKIPLFFGYGVGIENKHCHEIDVIAGNVELIKKEFEEGRYTPEFFADIREQYQSSYLEIDKLCSEDFGQDNNGRLAERFEKVSALIGVSQLPQLIALYVLYLDDYYSEKLKKVLVAAGGSPDAVQEWKSVLLTTTRSSFAQEEEDAMYAIALEMSKTGQTGTKDNFVQLCNDSKWQEALEGLVRDFGWFYMEYHKEPFTEENYRDHLWSYIQGNDLTSTPAQMRKLIHDRQEEFFAKYPNKDLQDLTFAFQEFAYILDNAKTISVKGIFRSRDLYKEVARRLGTIEKDMWYLVMPEVVTLLREGGKADVDLIATRKLNRAVLLADGELTVYEGAVAKQMAKDLIVDESVAEEGDVSVKGLVAYPGKVTGRVALINEIEEQGKFQPGDILVTRDGTVELTMLMKQAGAIVTNEGGIICHAAIVAREIKTPCIVGTRKATQVFKDGDMVEVDANSGVIRKI